MATHPFAVTPNAIRPLWNDLRRFQDNTSTMLEEFQSYADELTDGKSSNENFVQDCANYISGYLVETDCNLSQDSQIKIQSYYAIFDEVISSFSFADSLKLDFKIKLNETIKEKWAAWMIHSFDPVLHKSGEEQISAAIEWTKQFCIGFDYFCAEVDLHKRREGLTDILQKAFASSSRSHFALNQLNKNALTLRNETNTSDIKSRSSLEQAKFGLTQSHFLSLKSVSQKHSNLLEKCTLNAILDRNEVRPFHENPPKGTLSERLKQIFMTQNVGE